MNLKTVTLANLTPHPDNPNTHPAKQINALVESLTKFTQVKNVVIWNDRIIAGHGVIEAAKKAGLLTLEAQDISHWPEEKATEFMLADVRLPDMAIVDDEALVEALRAIDEPLEIPGFDEDFLKGLPGFGEDEPPGPSEPPIDKAEELQKKWGTELGQLWALGDHRLAVGDCTDPAVVEGVMGGEKMQNVLTDPPYGIDWNTDYTRFTTEYGIQKINHRAVKNDDKPFDPSPWLEYPKVILWGANWYCQHIPLGSWLVWDKRHPNGAAFLSDAEIAWMKGKKGVYLYAETVQGAHRKEKSVHPTQKPVGLMKWCIQKAQMEDSILDPFLGSGTTLIACENLNRRCRGIEIDPGYAAVTLQRFLDHTGIQPELI
jgi:hypothetical protein